jgi:hypothetical protein
MEQRFGVEERRVVFGIQYRAPRRRWAARAYAVAAAARTHAEAASFEADPRSAPTGGNRAVPRGRICTIHAATRNRRVRLPWAASPPEPLSGRGGAGGSSAAGHWPHCCSLGGWYRRSSSAATTPARLLVSSGGRGTAGIPTVAEDRLYGHRPMLLHDDPQDILVICFGVGNTMGAIARYPAPRGGRLRRAEPLQNRGALRDPRVTMRIEDGRNYLLTTEKRCDIIHLDPPELQSAGVVSLYTREFY